MARAVERVHTGTPELRSEVFEQVSDGMDLVLNFRVQRAELRHELVVEPDCSAHDRRMLSKTYEVKNISVISTAVSEAESGEGQAETLRRITVNTGCIDGKGNGTGGRQT